MISLSYIPCESLRSYIGFYLNSERSSGENIIVCNERPVTSAEDEKRGSSKQSVPSVYDRHHLWEINIETSAIKVTKGSMRKLN
jgi:hypothetical protein